MTAFLVSENTRNPFLNSPDTSYSERGDWVMQANCRNGDPDALFVRGAAQRRAAVICRQCPVGKGAQGKPTLTVAGKAIFIDGGCRLLLIPGSGRCSSTGGVPAHKPAMARR